jgi:signal transduction histidine kinase
MEQAATEPHWAEISARLRGNRQAIPWHERRELARSLAAVLGQATTPAPLAELLELLAADPKPEVRHAIAVLLVQMDDGVFARIAAALEEDSNAFVRNAVQRSLDRRRRGQQEATRKRRHAQEIQGDYAAMERMHGRPAAERARRMCERFAEVLVGTAVHNMRGVLTPMKITASALLRQAETESVDTRQLRDGLARIGDQVCFLERLLEDMRAYSQPVMAIRRRERLADVVAEARSVASEYLRGMGREPDAVDVAVSVPKGIMVDMARHQMVVALANLIKNAHEAFADGGGSFRAGQIGVEAQVSGDKVRVCVRDNGAGLATEDLRELREFVPGRTSKKSSGTGFGLPIARRYVMAHGGHLEIESELGGGTQVSVTLPLEHDEAEKP